MKVILNFIFFKKKKGKHLNFLSLKINTILIDELIDN